jgi:hypothetical protein
MYKKFSCEVIRFVTQILRLRESDRHLSLRFFIDSYTTNIAISLRS